MKNKIERSNVFDILYFCFLVILPFVYSGKIIDPVLIPRQIFLTLFLFIVVAIIFSWTYTKRIVSDFSFIKLSVPLLLFGFTLITLLSFSQAITITESYYVLSKLIITIVFFIVTTYLIIQQELSVTVLIKAIIVLGYVSVLVAVYQIVSMGFSGDHFLNHIHLITSSFANKNLFSSFLFLTIPFVVQSIFFSKPWKVASVLLLSIILLLLILIQTKAVIIAFIFSFLIFIGFIIQKKNIQFTFKYIFILLPIIVIVCFFVFQNRKHLPHLTNNHSAYTRLHIWDNSLQMAKEYPLLGVGAGNWQINFPKYELDKFDEVEIKNGLTTFQRPHNDYLWVFCETGIIGIITYLLVFIMVLYYLLQLFKNTNKQEEKRVYALFFATIIGYMLIAFVDFPMERMEHQLLLFLIFSIVVAKYYNIINMNIKPSSNAVKNIPFLLLLFIPIVFSFVISYKRCISEYHLHKIYNYQHQANWNQMIVEADKASTVFYSLDPMSAPIKWYKGVALFSLGNIAEAKQCFEQAYKIHPYNIHVLNNMASCYESEGNHNKAKEFYLKALSISPQFEEARLNLSAVYFNLKEYEKAFETINVFDPYAIHPDSYQIYLPVILNSWIELFLTKQKDTRIIKKITDIKNSKELTLRYYKDSKNKSILFETYLINY